MPTREELKAQYHIPNDDFQILTALPSEQEQRTRGGSLHKVGPTTYLWKRIGGAVLAVILVLAPTPGLFDWNVTATYPTDRINTYLETLDPAKERDGSGFILFTQHDDDHRPDTRHPQQWVVGTIVAPVSGSSWTQPP